MPNPQEEELISNTHHLFIEASKEIQRETTATDGMVIVALLRCIRSIADLYEDEKRAAVLEFAGGWIEKNKKRGLN